MPSKVLVVGAGATGSCAALQLRRRLGKDVQIEVWEKARGPGGRMSTNRQDFDGTTVRADMGAQYLTSDPGQPQCKEVIDELVASGVCAEVAEDKLSATPERVPRWRNVCGVSGGVNDALKALLDKAGAQVRYEQRVASIDEQGGAWAVRPFKGPPGRFDAVLLAVPGCGVGGDNMNKIHGGWENYVSSGQYSLLSGVQHDHRWSFALFLPLECAAKCDKFFGPAAFEKIVDKGSVHLLCYQSRKTAAVSGVAPSGSIVVVAHTSLAWAKRNARAGGRDQRLLQEVSEDVASVLALDGPMSKLMLGSKVITWKQCQVTSTVPAGPAGPCMLLSGSPPLLLAGDYFTNSSFGGCLESGFAAADLAASLLKGERTEAVAKAVAACTDPASAQGTKRKGESSKGYGDVGKGKDRKGKGKDKSGYQAEDNWSSKDWNKAYSSGGKGGKKGKDSRWVGA